MAFDVVLPLDESVPDDFDLWGAFFDIPGAFYCPLTVKGFVVYKNFSKKKLVS